MGSPLRPNRSRGPRVRGYARAHRVTPASVWPLTCVRACGCRELCPHRSFRVGAPAYVSRAREHRLQARDASAPSVAESSIGGVAMAKEVLRLFGEVLPPDDVAAATSMLLAGSRSSLGACKQSLSSSRIRCLSWSSTSSIRVSTTRTTVLRSARTGSVSSSPVLRAGPRATPLRRGTPRRSLPRRSGTRSGRLYRARRAALEGPLRRASLSGRPQPARQCLGIAISRKAKKIDAQTTSTRSAQIQLCLDCTQRPSRL
jgi:hypothetical protein